MKKNAKRLAAIITLAAGTTAAIHVLNKWIEKEADLGLLDTEETLTYNWRLCPVTYRKYGSGSPVLLLHELSACSSSFEWSRVIKALSADHTVYVPDLPGCGLSNKPNVTYTNFFFVELINDFIEQIIQEPCDVLATGISASLAVTSCCSKSSLFRKLILVNPVSPQQLSLIPNSRSKIRKKLLTLPVLGTMLYHCLISRSMLEREFSQRLFYKQANMTSSLVDAYYESGHKDSSNGRFLMASIVGNYVYFHIAHALQAIDNDIVIMGSDHQEYIRETITAYRRMNPAVESVILPDSRHLPQLETPEEFLKQLSVYIDE